MKRRIAAWMNFLRREKKWVAMIIVLLSIALHVYTLTVSSIHIPVNSDEALKILEAKDIARGNLKLFFWAQPYQFPLPAYINAPIVHLLPRNGFGARLLSYVLGFFSLAALLIVFRKMATSREVWPGVILVVFPSAYLLMIQFGYPMVSYVTSIFIWSLALLLLMYLPRDMNRKGAIILASIGFLCGIAFAGNMVAISIVVPLGIVACWGRGLKNMAFRTPVFGAGLFVGLLPHLVGMWRYPYAHRAVSGSMAWQSALSRIWNPALSRTLPRALGVNPTLFPDSNYTLGQPEWLVAGMGVVYMAILLSVTIVCVHDLIKTIVRREWLRISVREFFVGVAWLSMVLFLFSARAGAHAYRYMVPAVWVFPFLVYFAYTGLTRRLKPLLAAFAVLLAFFNVFTAIALIEEWKEPDYAKRVVHAPDLGPALDFLTEKGMKYCVASHWVAYRINFLTDEQILCSQPMNERFPGWPIPYKEEVDRQTNLAYVLTKYGRFLKPSVFENHLKTMDISSKQVTKGDFEIYYDFEQNRPPKSGRLILDEGMLKVGQSHAEAGNMIDGEDDSFWRSERLQHADMWVQIDLPAPAELDRLLIYRGIYANDHPIKLAIEKKVQHGWEKVSYTVYDDWGDRFRFQSGHPVYGPPIVKTYLFDETTAEALRLRIVEPRDSWAWTITDLDLHGNYIQQESDN